MLPAQARMGPSLIGNNLLPRGREYRAGTAPETYERSVRVRSVWRF